MAPLVIFAVSRSQVVTDAGVKFETYWMTVFDKQHVTFAVKACSDAHILLSSHPGIIDPTAFELIIGQNGNKETQIRKYQSKDSLKTIDTPFILRCGTFSQFWVSWDRGLITFGRGITIGVNRLLEYEDPSKLKINGLSFDGAQRGVTWAFDEVKGQLDTNSGYSSIQYSFMEFYQYSYSFHRE